MLCPSCGYEINEHDTICKGCGTSVPRGVRMRLATDDSTPFSDLMFQDDENENAVLRRTSVIEVKENESVKKAGEEAAARSAAAKEAAARAAAAKDRAAQALKEAVLKDTAAKEAATREKAAVADVEKAKSDIDKAIRESAMRTAAKQATLERSEAAKAREKAITLKEAADKLALEAAEKASAARKAADEAARVTAAASVKEAQPKPAGADAVANKAVSEAAAAKAAAPVKEVKLRPAGAEIAAEKAAGGVSLKTEEQVAAKKEEAQTAARIETKETAARIETRETAARIETREAAEKKSGEKTAQLKYRIAEGNFPYVSILLNMDQSIYTQGDAMVWMSAGIAMTTHAKGAGSPFTATYISGGDAQEIGIAGRSPGGVLCLELGASAVIVQKSAFLAAQPSVRLSAHVSMHLGEGAKSSFAFQRLSGSGVAFIAVSGGTIGRKRCAPAK